MTPAAPGPWVEDAACRTLGPSYMFVEPSRAEAWSRNMELLVRERCELCHSCPVLVPCREWALTRPDPAEYGVAGGMSYRDRKRWHSRNRSCIPNTGSTTIESAPAPSVSSTRSELTNTEPRMRGLDASADTDGTSPHPTGRNKRTAA